MGWVVVLAGFSVLVLHHRVRVVIPPVAWHIGWFGGIVVVLVRSGRLFCEVGM
jgi:hypothetical protein